MYWQLLIRNLFLFSAGLWPHQEEIADLGLVPVLTNWIDVTKLQIIRKNFFGSIYFTFEYFLYDIRLLFFVLGRFNKTFWKEHHEITLIVQNEIKTKFCELHPVLSSLEFFVNMKKNISRAGQVQLTNWRISCWI